MCVFYGLYKKRFLRITKYRIHFREFLNLTLVNIYLLINKLTNLYERFIYITIKYSIMSQNNGCIYIIKNFANGKYYIGKTVRQDSDEKNSQQIVQRRFQEHLREAFAKDSATYNYCLSRGIRKWGTQAFDVGILADNIPEEELMMVEAHYIDMYGTLDPEIGYNTSPGFNDNSNIDAYREIQPDDDYDSESQVNLEELSNEDIENFLKEL